MIDAARAQAVAFAPLEFTVPGLPVAQPRQRHRLVTTAGRTFASNYTPTKHPANAWKATVRHAFAAVHAGAPLEGPVGVDLVLVFPRPAGRVWKRRPMPRERHAKKPDAENVAKALLDALSGLAWRDDAQVCELRVAKWIAAGDEQPHTVVRIAAPDGRDLLATCNALPNARRNAHGNAPRNTTSGAGDLF